MCRHCSLPSPLPSLSFHIPYSLPYLILLLLCPLPFPLSYSFLLRLLEKNFMPSLCQNYTLCNKVDVAQWQSAGLSISRSVVLIQVGRYFFSFSFASCDIKNTIIIFLMYKKITSSHLLCGVQKNYVSFFRKRCRAHFGQPSAGLRARAFGHLVGAARWDNRYKRPLLIKI